MRYLQLTVLRVLARLQTRSNIARQKLGFKLPRWIWWFTLGAMLAGCAGIGVDSAQEDKQKFVAQRAHERWQLLIKGDVASAYEFLSPGSKATMPLEVYKARLKPGMWVRASVEKVDCEKQEICHVVVVVDYDARQMKGIQTQLPETWVIERGSAWYVYR